MPEQTIEKMTLYQKLAGIRKMVEVIRKNKSGFGYKYVSEDEILARVTAGMDKYHLLLCPSIVPETMTVTPLSYKKVKYIQDKRTGETERREDPVNEVLIKAEMTFTWINLDNQGEQMVIPWTLVGQQSDASQAVGSGLSYLHRYFLLKFFQIATPEDDPDNWRSKKQKAAAAEEKAILAGMIEEIERRVSAILNGVKDKNELPRIREKLAETFKNFVRDKSGQPSKDYRLVSDIETANKILEALKGIDKTNAA